jgi:hypothetical protein
VAGCRLILVVDQFEEVFAAGGEEAAAERAAFITALHAAATVPNGPAEIPAAMVAIAVAATSSTGAPATRRGAAEPVRARLDDGVRAAP